MCNCKCILNAVISVIVGIIVAVLSFLCILVAVQAVWVALALAVLILLILIFLVVFGDDDIKKCICSNGICLAIGVVGTIAVSLLILAIVHITFLFAAVLFGIGGFFLSLMIISLLQLLICLVISNCSCRC